MLRVTNNAYQIERARDQTDESGLSDLAEYLECDFMNVGSPGGSFDAIYSIESLCHAPDRAGVYSEAFRLLKPGGHIAVYEWCLTNRFETQNPRHFQMKEDEALAEAD